MTEKRRNEIDSYNKSILNEKIETFDYSNKLTYARLEEHTKISIHILKRIISTEEIYELNKLNYYPTQLEKMLRLKRK